MPPKKATSTSAAARKAPAAAAKKAAVARTPVVVASSAPVDATPAAPASVATKKRDEAVKALLHAQAVADIDKTGSETAPTIHSLNQHSGADGPLAQRMARLLHSSMLVCSLHRVLNGVPSSRPSTLLLNASVLESVERTCFFSVSLNHIAALARVFPNLVEVAWESGGELGAPVPRLRFASNEVTSYEALLNDLQGREMAEAKLVAIEETTCAPVTVPPPSNGKPRGASAPRPSTPVSSAPAAAFPGGVGGGGSSLNPAATPPGTPMRQQQQRGSAATAMPPPSPYPRLAHKLIGDGEIGEPLIDQLAANKRRSQSLDLPPELLSALPDHKIAAVVEALRYEQDAADQCLVPRLNANADLEKLLGQYDLVRCVFGDRTSIGGAKLLQVLVSQGRHGEPPQAVERRLLQLTEYPESGLVARPPSTSMGGVASAGPRGVAGLIFFLDPAASSRKLLAARIEAALESSGLQNAPHASQ